MADTLRIFALDYEKGSPCHFDMIPLDRTVKNELSYLWVLLCHKKRSIHAEPHTGRKRRDYVAELEYQNQDPGNEHVTRRPLLRVSNCLHVIRLIVFFTIWALSQIARIRSMAKPDHGFFGCLSPMQ